MTRRMKYKYEDRNQFRFPIDRHSPTDGYEKVRFLLDLDLPWGTWRFTAHAIWINNDEPGRDAAMHFRLRYGDQEADAA